MSADVDLPPAADAHGLLLFLLELEEEEEEEPEVEPPAQQ